jgi:succinate dehydrogenase / fumarate reductase cytochrome b subunit
MTAVTASLFRFYDSSIGKKSLIALTGTILVGFLLGHLVGNLLIFAGRDAINEYGHFLQTAGHGMLVWIARVVIFESIILHAILTIQVTRRNRASREQKYGKEHTQVASKSSRMMIVSGLTILAFFIYHILHFTARKFNDYDTYKTLLDGHEVHDVYRMVIAGFSWFPASAFYIIAMVLLCSHLSHGVASMFQTLGLGTDKTRPLFEKLGKAYALFILVGNCSIPIAIYCFNYPR